MKSRYIIISFSAIAAFRIFLASVTPVFETSEARYAAISANMDRTNDFLVPHFTYKDRYQSFDGKPPLLFQLSALCRRIFGHNEFAVRFPAIAVNGIMLLLLWKTVLALSCGERADLAVSIATTCTAYYALSGFCMPDALLTPCVASAYFCHILHLHSEKKAWAMGVFAALAAGMLVKGPIAIVLFAGPVFLDTCINKRWKRIAQYPWLSGLALFFLIAAPWFILMHRQNPGFLEYFFINENLKRFLVHNYGDKYGAGREFFRGMAIIWAAVVTLPWFPLAWGIIRQGKNEGLRILTDKGETESVLTWGLIGIIGFWCLTSRVPLPYLMPIAPLFAAWLALKSDRDKLKGFLPYAALGSVLILSTSLIIGMTCTRKMPGEGAPYRRGRYSYEFYHGTPVFAKEANDEIPGTGNPMQERSKTASGK